MKKNLIISVVAIAVLAFGVSISDANYSSIESFTDSDYIYSRVPMINTIYFKDKVHSDGKILVTVVAENETLLNSSDKSAQYQRTFVLKADPCRHPSKGRGYN